MMPRAGPLRDGLYSQAVIWKALRTSWLAGARKLRTLEDAAALRWFDESTAIFDRVAQLGPAARAGNAIAALRAPGAWRVLR